MLGLGEDVLKRRLAQRGVAVPRGVVVDPNRPSHEAGALELPVVVKALVPVTDRARKGLIHFARDTDELSSAITDLGTKHADGHRVRRVLVEEQSPPGDEWYLGATFDHVLGKPVLLCGPGGSGVEGRDPPQQIVLPPTLEIPPGHIDPRLIPVADALLAEFSELRALLVEINPVRLTPEGAVVLDAKATLDPSAAVPEGAVALTADSEDELLEVEPGLKGGATARFGPLGGDIGLISAGGGVLSVVLDGLARRGLAAANFSDVSAGTATDRMLGLVAERVARLKPRAVLVTSGITSSVAVTALAVAVRDGLVAGAGSVAAVNFPVVARLAGEGEEEAAVVMSELPMCRVLGREFTIEDTVDELARWLAEGPHGDPA